MARIIQIAVEQGDTILGLASNGDLYTLNRGEWELIATSPESDDD